MQTFLPHPSFGESLRCLDRFRLGKQRIEAWMLLEILLGHREGGGWEHHPACKMWKGSARSLCYYGLVACKAWQERGYRDSMSERFMKLLPEATGDGPPPWLGEEVFHLSHRSNLVRKNPAFYGPLFPGTPSDLPYFWPEGRET